MQIHLGFARRGIPTMMPKHVFSEKETGKLEEKLGYYIFCVGRILFGFVFVSQSTLSILSNYCLFSTSLFST